MAIVRVREWCSSNGSIQQPGEPAPFHRPCIPELKGGGGASEVAKQQGHSQQGSGKFLQACVLMFTITNHTDLRLEPNMDILTLKPSLGSPSWLS
jgi:hypothetical protein